MDKANNNSQELYGFVAALQAALASKADQTATQTALDAKLNANLLGAASGAASLDAGSKLLTSQIPDSILAGLKWQGTWNAATNTPAIPAAATGNNGWFYKVSVAGTSSITGSPVAFGVGDWLISNGTVWQRVANTESVTSVAGRTGAVTLAKADVGLSNVDNTSDANKPVSTAQQAAIDAKVGLSSYTAKGALLAGTAAGAVAAVPLGTVGQLLQANPALESGVEWVTPSSGVVINDQAASGYIDIGTTRIQWGISGTATGVRTVNLQAPFANGAYSVTANCDNASAAPPQLSRAINIGGKTATSFQAVVSKGDNTDSNFAFSWQAIGLKPA
jgi:hypothetical protein